MSIMSEPIRSKSLSTIRQECPRGSVGRCKCPTRVGRVNVCRLNGSTCGNEQMLQQAGMAIGQRTFSNAFCSWCLSWRLASTGRLGRRNNLPSQTLQRPRELPGSSTITTPLTPHGGSAACTWSISMETAPCFRIDPIQLLIPETPSLIATVSCMSTFLPYPLTHPWKCSIREASGAARPVTSLSWDHRPPHTPC